MYIIIYLISYYTREFILPNPFGNIMQNEIVAIIFNALIGESIIGAISYSMCGIFYKKGNGHTWLGSLGYMFFFLLNFFIIINVTKITSDIKNFSIIYFSIIIVIYILLLWLKKKITYFSYRY